MEESLEYLPPWVQYLSPWVENLCSICEKFRRMCAHEYCVTHHMEAYLFDVEKEWPHEAVVYETFFRSCLSVEILI
jgi:hypothetical protein